MSCTNKMHVFSSAFVFLLLFFVVSSASKKDDNEQKKKEMEEKWKKKDIKDYSEADMERLFDQWEENDEDELPEDELPEWKREPPKIDLSQIDPKNPEGALKMSKKGRSLMMFATVSDNPTEKETETITQLWQHSLFNANIDVQRYVVGANRVIFMLKDGSMAWDIKDYLIQQDRCEEVTIEGKSYPGAASKEDNKTKKQKDDSGKTAKDSESSSKYAKDKNIQDNKTKKDKKEKEEL